MRRLMATVGGAVLAVTLVTGGAASASTATRVPRACARALDSAERMLDYAVQGFTIIGNALSEAGEGNYAALYDATDELSALSPRIGAERATFDRFAAKCRAA